MQIHNIYILSLLVLAQAVLYSCKSDDNGDGPGNQISAENLPMVLSDPSADLLLVHSTGLTLEDGAAVYEGDTIRWASGTTNITPGTAYPVSYRGEDWSLYLTALPVLSIAVDQAIDETSKVEARMRLQSDNQNPQDFISGIEYRGSGEDDAKRNFAFEVREAAGSEEEINTVLLGMREDDDWILDGMFSEPNQLRDFTAHDLWLDLERTANLPAGAQAGISREYVEVFVNNQYLGIYYLGERLDRKQLQLVKYEDAIRGELYRGDDPDGTAAYMEVVDIEDDSRNWGSLDAEYPTDKDDIVWTSIYDHVNWAVNASSANIGAEMEQRVDLDNAIDYFLLVNVLGAQDNISNNRYTARSDQNLPYFFLPWNMGDILGLDADGNRVTTSSTVYTNGLYNRLEQQAGYVAKLKARWNEVKQSTLSTSNLAQRFATNAALLDDNGAYERQARNNALAPTYSDAELDYISAAITARWSVVDGHVTGL